MTIYSILIQFLILAAVFIGSRGIAQTSQKDLAQDLASSRDKLVTLESQENLALLRHHPVYIIYGNPNTKAQFSFKFLIVRSIPLYVSYSQLIFWQLHEKSKPFEDATYNPEIFYRWSLGRDHFTSLDFGPWGHHSNGKDGDSSRSIDESFIRFRKRFDAKNLTLLLSGTASAQYNLDDTNRDSYKYHGPFEFQASLINFFELTQIIDKSDLTARFFPGGRFGERWYTGGYELGFNFRFGALDVFPTFYLQYYQYKKI